MVRLMILALLGAAVFGYLAIWLIKGDLNTYPWQFDKRRFGKAVGWLMLLLLLIALIVIPVTLLAAR